MRAWLVMAAVLSGPGLAALGQTPQWIMGKGNSFTRLERQLDGGFWRMSRLESRGPEPRAALLDLEGAGFSHSIDRHGHLFPVSLVATEVLADGQVQVRLRILNVYPVDLEDLSVEAVLLERGARVPSKARRKGLVLGPRTLLAGDSCIVPVTLPQPSRRVAPMLSVQVAALDGEPDC